MASTLRTIAFALVGIVSLALSGCDETPTDGVEKITYNMSWLPQGSQAGVIVAIEKGYYRDLGLDVDAVRGFGGIRTVNELDQGMFAFGYGDPLAVVLNRSNGGKTKMIGSINTRWPSGLCFVRERHVISAPADLKGLTVGGGQNSPMQVIVPAWLERNDVARSDVKVLQLDPAIVVTSLIEGQIDAGECWLGNSMALFEKRAKDAGVTLGWLPYADFNLDIYGNGIITTEKMIVEKPDVVRNFLAATYKGYDYAIKHPDEATEIMVKRFPVLDAAITKQQLLETAALIKGETPMGWLGQEKISETITFLKSAYSINQEISADDVYTTEFLPEPAQ